ncbi:MULTISPECIES: L-aspartate oxidase [unclassified Alcanivorax]|uniref:L-aspartate oxidase n=1 Tax=unclassified Alcanivorax TaxID=2638842 RepID=UPI0008A008E2|nr:MULTISPECIES: L-aspartate oxidase [unclassified Alcanivorax]MEE3388081.1 L-aspartate oxidase [Pseudomonadota bacterium]SEF40790.1 L-aspartate oxidase [Alcanivorax sp. DSM 26293]
MATFRHDVLIIGSGAAGLTTALRLPDDCRIALLSKGELTSASTYYAQGGVAAVLDQEDSLESHVADTHVAGGGLCHDDAVRYTVENGPDAIRWLIDLGVDFTRLTGDNDSALPYHLTREGGHSHRRIIHAADATGKAISGTLIGQVRKKDNVTRFEYRVAVDLILQEHNGPNGQKGKEKRCCGAYVHNIETGETDVILARAVVLATGGASKVYLYTSNPDVATGDGIAMAWRAGCRVANMEFMQFHPTCLYHPKAKSFLVTEAIRGEGGHLLLPSGERFMHRFDERGELAPRDVVARAIDHEMKRLGADCLYLDISHKPADFIIEHFPTVYAKCLQLGLDITRDPMPVVPAAHYTCGGVMINENGQTDVPGLYAIGETSFTGLHGANRMASNSLLECLVYGKASAEHIGATLADVPEPREHKEWDESQVTDSDEDVVISHNWDELRRFMWDYVGIVRTEKRLERALHRAELLRNEIAEYYSNYHISNDLLELRNLVVIAELIIRSAMQRKESRGLHFMRDYPGTNDEVVDTVLTPPIS